MTTPMGRHGKQMGAKRLCQNIFGKPFNLLSHERLLHIARYAIN